MAQGDTLLAGSSYLVGGADSWTQPIALDDIEYVAGMNVVCRGGRIRTRPGSKIMANLPIPRGNLQGGTLFIPNAGTPAIVVAVDGEIWVTNPPFREFVKLSGLQFNPLSKFVAWAQCEQSTDYTVDGELYFLDNPKSVLIIQDGVTRAAYWDGVNHGHINPGPSPGAVTQPGYDGTKIGLWMAWSNNRLWVSRDNQVFASDIGNPLKFTETQYLNEGRAFYLASNCRGIIETPDKDGILCFTEKDATLLLSSIQDRTQWLTTKDFQKTIIPYIGCVAPRSLVNQYGLTWWFSPTGLQNLNSALNQNISSKISYQDAEMSSSKEEISPDMSIICAGYYENYLVVSVPSADPFNKDTWCLDQNPFEGGSNVWASRWTGWRPVEWFRGVVGNSERVFFVSKDQDGVNRLWEGFLPQRKDNGCPITCTVLTKQHTFGDLRRKKMRFSKLFLADINGHVSLRWWNVPQNGAPYDAGSKEIEATVGQVYSNQEYGDNANNFAANRPQTRTVYSQENTTTDSNCDTCGIEKQDEGNLDYSFGLFIAWSGDMSLSAYQIFASSDPEADVGRCEDNEEEPRSVNASGCGALSFFPSGNVFEEEFTATATVCVADDNSSSASDSSSASGSDSSSASSSGDIVCSTVTKTSIISQEDADRKAECAATFDANFRADRFV